VLKEKASRVEIDLGYVDVKADIFQEFCYRRRSEYRFLAIILNSSNCLY
jgi:hypothetical protein